MTLFSSCTDLQQLTADRMLIFAWIKLPEMSVEPFKSVLGTTTALAIYGKKQSIQDFEMEPITGAAMALTGAGEEIFLTESNSETSPGVYFSTSAQNPKLTYNANPNHRYFLSVCPDGQAECTASEQIQINPIVTSPALDISQLQFEPALEAAYPNELFGTFQDLLMQYLPGDSKCPAINNLKDELKDPAAAANFSLDQLDGKLDGIKDCLTEQASQNSGALSRNSMKVGQRSDALFNGNLQMPSIFDLEKLQKFDMKQLPNLKDISSQIKGSLKQETAVKITFPLSQLPDSQYLSIAFVMGPKAGGAQEKAATATSFQFEMLHSSLPLSADALMQLLTLPPENFVIIPAETFQTKGLYLIVLATARVNLDGSKSLFLGSGAITATASAIMVQVR